MAFAFRPFTAVYDGTQCANCSWEVVSGELIGYNEEDLIEHAECWAADHPKTQADEDEDRQPTFQLGKRS